MSCDTWKLLFKFSIFCCITFGTDDTLNHISIFSKNEKMLKRRQNFSAKIFLVQQLRTRRKDKKENSRQITDMDELGEWNAIAIY